MKDLMAHLCEQYRAWTAEGKLTIGDKEVSFDFDRDGKPVEDFVAFARKYLSLNRIAVVGYETGMLGMTLSDGSHYPFVDVKPPSNTDTYWDVSFPITGKQPGSQTAPAWSIPITKGD